MSRRPHSRGLRWLGWAACGVWLAASAHASGGRVADRAEGSIAARDCYAPVEFLVIDPVATASTLALGRELAPVVVRHDEQAADVVVERLRGVFEQTRNAFLQAVERSYGGRVVDGGETNSPAFRQLHAEFQAANPILPVSLVLAQSWASGDDGASILERMSGVLRMTMKGRLIGEIRAASTVFLVSIGPDARVRTWGEVSGMAKMIEPSTIATTEAAGLELRRMLDGQDRMAGGFLSGLLHPNLIEDSHLTALLFSERLRDRAVSRPYQRGDLLARKGAVLDRWGALALRHLDRSGIAPAETPIAQVARPPLPVDTAKPQRLPVWPDRGRNGWQFLGGAGVLVAILAASVLWRRRRRRKASPAVLPVVRAQPRLKEALLPHLARELKDRLVHALFAQRHALLENEEDASVRVAEMEERLSRLQPAIASRIREYEARIAALERELAEKDEDARDLIHAKLVLARKERDAEIVRNRIGWN